MYSERALVIVCRKNVYWIHGYSSVGATGANAVAEVQNMPGETIVDDLSWVGYVYVVIRCLVL